MPGFPIGARPSQSEQLGSRSIAIPTGPAGYYQGAAYNTPQQFGINGFTDPFQPDAITNLSYIPYGAPAYQDGDSYRLQSVRQSQAIQALNRHFI